MNEYDLLILQEQVVQTNTPPSTWVVIVIPALIGFYFLIAFVGLVMWLFGRLSLRKNNLDNSKIIKFNRIRKIGMILIAVCIVVFIGICLFLEFGPKLYETNI